MQRYQTDTIIKNEDGKRFFPTQYHPHFEITDFDIWITTKRLDRLDNIAFKYYGDHTLWWVIAKANNLVNGTINVPAAIELRIPDPKIIANQIDLILIERQNAV